MSTYSTATAAARIRQLYNLSISASTVKNYSDDRRIQPALSDSSHPGKGKKRLYCETDLSILASIYRQQQQGISITDAAARGRDGVLLEAPTDSYRQPPEEGAQPVIDATGAPQTEDATANTAPSAALIVRAVADAIEPMWERVAAAEARASAAEAIISELRRELEQARRPWWRRLLGR